MLRKNSPTKSFVRNIVKFTMWLITKLKLMKCNESFLFFLFIIQLDCKTFIKRLRCFVLIEFRMVIKNIKEEIKCLFYVVTFYATIMFQSVSFSLPSVPNPFPITRISHPLKQGSPGERYPSLLKAGVRLHPSSFKEKILRKSWRKFTQKIAGITRFCFLVLYFVSMLS